MTGKTTFKDRALRAIAILGLIAILLLGAWGIIQIAFTLYGFLGSSTPTPSPAAVVTPAKAETVVVTAPAVINSGVPFTLSFVHENTSGNYAYEISYSCASGLSVQAPLPTGSLQAVPCNTPFNYTNTTGNVQLTATLTGSTQAVTSFNVSATNLATNATTATGAAASTVLPPVAAAKPAPAPTTTSTPGSTYVAATRTTSLYGSPDLSVAMGNVTDVGGRYSVQFTIQNVGTNIAPAGWTFNASLPTSPTYTYASSQQQALYPGDKIVYTLGFTMQNNTYGYNTTPTYPYGPTYQSNCGYSTNYTYNGTYTYPNIAYACNTGTTYNYTPSYASNYGSNYTYPTYTYGPYVMTVTANPNGYMQESNTANNSASVTLSDY